MVREFVENFKLAMRIALFILGLFVGTVTLVAGTRAALAASLKTEGIVTGDYIKLGDVFSGVKNAEYVLGPAPAPGKDMILNARTLYKIASALDVDWSPNSSTEQLILRREAVVIPQTEVTAKLESQLREKGIDGKFAINYIGEPSDIVLPAGSAKTMEITAFNFDPQKDSFDAVIVSPSAANPAKRITLSGRVERLVAVPVLLNSLKSGDIIGTNDIDWIELPQTKIANGTVLDAKDIINMTPRRNVFGGKPIINNELEHPKMVGRGEDITLVFTSGPIILTTKGKSLQAGAIGDTVRVANTDSNKNLQGVVTAHREVTIR